MLEDGVSKPTRLADYGMKTFGEVFVKAELTR